MKIGNDNDEDDDLPEVATFLKRRPTVKPSSAASGKDTARPLAKKPEDTVQRQQKRVLAKKAAALRPEDILAELQKSNAASAAVTATATTESGHDKRPIDADAEEEAQVSPVKPAVKKPRPKAAVARHAATKNDDGDWYSVSLSMPLFSKGKNKQGQVERDRLKRFEQKYMRAEPQAAQEEQQARPAINALLDEEPNEEAGSGADRLVIHSSPEKPIPILSDSEQGVNEVFDVSEEEEDVLELPDALKQQISSYRQQLERFQPTVQAISSDHEDELDDDDLDPELKAVADSVDRGNDETDILNGKKRIEVIVRPFEHPQNEFQHDPMVFVIRRSHPFEKAMQEYSNTFGVSVQDVVFIYRGLRLLPYNTPASLQVFDEVQLESCTRGFYDSKFHQTQRRAGDPVPDTDQVMEEETTVERITVKLNNKGSSMELRVPKEITIGELAEKYAKKMGIQAVRLEFDGETVDAQETLESLDAEDGDQLDVVPI